MSPNDDRGKPAERVTCAGALVFDEQHRLLVVRRGRPPGLGLWSVPGGRVEDGEAIEAAVEREVREETGLEVEVGPLVGRVERPGLGGAVYDIWDYTAVAVGGTLQAGDDAAEVRWVSAAELAALPVTDGLLDILGEWGTLPR